MMLPTARRAAPRLLKYTLPTASMLPSMHFHSSTPVLKRDFYEILGVSSGASKSEIKKKYYELAKKFHPDTNKEDPNAAKKFAEATEAWEVLGDDDKRQKYDTFGHAGVDPNGGGGDGFHGGFEDIFASMFGHQAGGRRSGRPQPQRGADVQVNCHISFMEAVNGTTRDLNLNTDVTCEPCDGSGAKPGTSKRKCKSCGGSGVEILQQGFFAVEQPCRRTTGFIIETPCTSCRGRGKVKKARTVEVKIPEGVDNGMNLRLAHQGEAGSKGAIAVIACDAYELCGPSGHLYVSISVASDPFFKRNKTDVHCEVPISVAQAILGGSVVVPTLTGQVEMTIPKGTQSGTTLKMRGKGIKELNSTRRGSQLVTMNVHIPDTLSARQKELMEEFAKEEEARGVAGESSCKSHTFSETVQKTVDRIKQFLKPDEPKKD
ncbi:chaperone protein dnaJ [Achlya hypogyna]|uniref:Chaperone protein dnaJ n=1 Tax=Achlya hypogyna TaxID=1202772 RepID=A0A1V9ZRC3_ACHHY|nr:chaperone protein dnaJ [Achlya hypogyna]